MLTATKTARTAFLTEPECIVVDLDGTLVFTDTFVATLLEAVRKDFRSIIPLVVAWKKGRSQCKSLAATLAPLDAAALPYNQALIEYLRSRRPLDGDLSLLRARTPLPRKMLQTTWAFSLRSSRAKMAEM